MAKVPESAAPYDALAPYYNLYWSEIYTLHILPVVERLLLSKLAPGSALLDVCCGNGHMVQHLRAAGFAADGLDGSGEMLTYARQNNGPEVTFIHADARQFQTRRRYAAATSFCSSLNHVFQTSQDMLKTFQSVARCLEPGGWFLFDLVMEDQIHDSSLVPVVVTGDNHAISVEGDFLEDQRLGRMKLRIQWLPSPEARQPLAQELTMFQRCYSESAIRQTLKKAGFEVVYAGNSVPDLGLDSVGPRRFFLARRAD